jgi:hypothetical protein
VLPVSIVGAWIFALKPNERMKFVSTVKAPDKFRGELGSLQKERPIIWPRPGGDVHEEVATSMGAE